jgi:hypothetical protein
MSEWLRATEERFKLLELEEKAKVITLLGYHLSEISRASYPEARKGNIDASYTMTVFNEMTHMIFKFLLALQGRSIHVYLLDSFFGSLLEHAKHINGEEAISWAMDKVWEEYCTE